MPQQCGCRRRHNTITMKNGRKRNENLEFAANVKYNIFISTKYGEEKISIKNFLKSLVVLKSEFGKNR